VAGSDPLDDLEAWAAEARAREAAESRVRERWLRTQAEEGASFAATLAGLVERGEPVTVMTAAGRPVAGRLTAVGADFVGLRLPGGRRTLIALGAVAWVQAAPGARPAPDAGLGDREEDEDAAPGASLIDVLAQAAASRPRVMIQTGAAAVGGDLRAVGLDMLSVETAGTPPSLAYVPVGAVYEISFFASG